MAARFVTNDGRMTQASVLMKKCGWLDIKEQTQYQSLAVMWRIIRCNKPSYFSEKLTLDGDNHLILVPARLITTGQSFRWKTGNLWNSLPDEMRGCQSLPSFKRGVKKWIIGQRPDAAAADREPDG